MKTKKTKKNVKYGSGYRGMFGISRKSELYCYPTKDLTFKAAILHYLKRFLSKNSSSADALKEIYSFWYEAHLLKPTDFKTYESLQAEWLSINNMVAFLILSQDQIKYVDDTIKDIRDKLKNSNYFRSSFNKCGNKRSKAITIKKIMM